MDGHQDAKLNLFLILLKNASIAESFLEASFHNKRQCTQVQRTELNYHYIYDWLARFFSLCDCSVRDMEIIFTLSQLWERIRTIFYKTLVIYDDFGCKYNWNAFCLLTVNFCYAMNIILYIWRFIDLPPWFHKEFHLRVYEDKTWSSICYKI